MEESIKSAIIAYKKEQFAIEQFLKRLVNFFLDHPELNQGSLPVIHSVKYRLKDPAHLREKIQRKWEEKGEINGKNIFDKITDLAGLRILHLKQSDFISIHTAIQSQINQNEWFLHEPPIAYTWDHVTEKYFKNLGLDVSLKESYYTSVHYLLKPRSDSFIKCELQVRTLYEEVWGEVDHAINYPEKTTNEICIEQLNVLAKITASGTKMVDTIFKTSTK